MSIKIISWNINGIRSLMKKEELYNLINKYKPNILCFSETKISCPFIHVEKELKNKIKGYRYRFWSPCLIKNGYSGTAIFSKKKPINVIYGLGENKLDQEGRVITLEFDNYFLINVYTPNSGMALKRLKYRITEWDIAFRKYIFNLNKIKNIMITGDLNVAYQDIDIHNPKNNKKNAGFTDDERYSFGKLLNSCNLIDTYRKLNPNKIEYSYWTYKFTPMKF